MKDLKKPSAGRKLWRSLRGLYYWPGQIITHGLRLARIPRSAWYRITAPWIVIGAYPDSKLRVRARSWYHFRHKFTFNGEHVRFNIDYAIRSGAVKGIALIFFMGLGDYFFTTPLLAALKKRYPQLPIIGFASKNGGSVNSPMLGDVLRSDPNLDEVRLYDGRQTRRYKNYDYRDALRQVPPQYLAIPVLYEHLPRTPHRLVSLFETFGLPIPDKIPTPLLHTPSRPSPHVARLLEDIKQDVTKAHLHGVVFLQTDSRSSHYVYPHADKLVAGLCARGYFVVSASALNHKTQHSHALNFKEFALMDSIHLLKLLREAFPETYIVSVASVFWSVSAGLDIPNLGMQHFPDDAMHNFWYPNITVITHRPYPRLPAASQILAKPGEYALDARGFAVFEADYVLTCFDAMRNKAHHGSDQETVAQSLRTATI